MQAWTKRMGERRSGIHVSDLLHCRRLSAFRALDPNPSPPDIASIKNMLVGLAVHRQVQALLSTTEYDHEKSIVWTSKAGVRIHATPDIRHKATGVIVELKTTSAIRVMTKPYPNHVEQLKIYLS